MRSDSRPLTPAGVNLLLYPSALLSSGRLRKIAASLQATGWFSQTRIVGILSDDAPAKEELSPGVSVTRVRGARLRSPLGGVRIMLFWPLRVYRAIRRERVAAVSAQNVYLLPLAHRLSRKTGAIFAYNAHELETETIGSTGLKQWIARRFERRYIYQADVVSVVNDSIADWYVSHYPGLRRPVVLTNTPVDAGGTVDLRGQLGIPDGELLYIHVGFLMEGRSIPLLIRAFAEAPNAHLAFLGDGYLRPEVERAAASHPNIHLLPLVAPEAVVSVVRGADVGICLIEPVSLSDRLSTPNKLMESLAAGVPPLSSDLVEARRLLGEQLSETWILKDPERELDAALAHLTHADVAAFAEQWRGIPSWDQQVVDLIAAYGRAMGPTPAETFQ